MKLNRYQRFVLAECKIYAKNKAKENKEKNRKIEKERLMNELLIK